MSDGATKPWLHAIFLSGNLLLGATAKSLVLDCWQTFLSESRKATPCDLRIQLPVSATQLQHSSRQKMPNETVFIRVLLLNRLISEKRNTSIVISCTCKHEYHGKEGITQSFRDDQGTSLGPEDLATLWKAEYEHATTAFDEISKYHTELQAFHEADTPSYYHTGDREITIHHLSLLPRANYDHLFPAKKPEYGTTEDPDVDR